LCFFLSPSPLYFRWLSSLIFFPFLYSSLSVAHGFIVEWKRWKMWVRKVRKSFADNLTLLRIFFSIEILATIQFRFWAEKRKSSLQKTFRSKTKTNKQKQFCTKTRKDNISFCKSVKCTPRHKISSIHPSN
jgi:hypothetical protein